jgi:hypothetical protein
MPRGKLLTVDAIVDPLAGGDDGRVADHGHQVAVAARLRLENAKAVLSVVEGHPLDEPGEHFLGRWAQNWISCGLPEHPFLSLGVQLGHREPNTSAVVTLGPQFCQSQLQSGSPYSVRT